MEGWLKFSQPVTAARETLFWDTCGNAPTMSLKMSATGQVRGYSNFRWSQLGTGSVETQWGPEIDDGQWHHVALVGDTRRFELWVDGVVVAREVPAQGRPQYCSGAAYGWAGGSGLQVHLDEFAIYHRALTPADVQANYIASGRQPALTLSEMFGPNGSLRNQGLAQVCECDPVDVLSGNLHMPLPGVQVAGRGAGLGFELGYNSLATSTSVDSVVGAGWSSTLDMGLEVAPGGVAATVTQETGSTVPFSKVGGVWVAPERFVASLVESGGGWVFTRNHVQSFRFDADGRLVELFDRFGNSTSVAYTGSSVRADYLEDDAGRRLTFGWEGDRLDTITDPLAVAEGGPRVVDLTHDGNGDLVGYRDVSGGLWSFTYDGGHRLLTMRKPRHQSSGPVVENGYDSAGRVVWQDDELDRRTSIAYDSPAVGSTVVTLPGGRQRLHRFEDGRRVETIDGWDPGDPSAGVSSVVNLDPDTYALVSVEDNAGNETRFSDPDGDGNVDVVEDATGRITRFSYDGFDQVTETRVGEIRTGPSSTDVSQVVTTLNVYDPINGRLEATTVAAGSPDAAVTDYVYGDPAHPEDVTRVIDGRGHAWDFSYAPGTGYQLGASDPLGNTTATVYNSVGWPVKVTSPEGVATPAPGDFETVYGYDVAGRTTTVTDPTGVVTREVLDANANTISVATGITGANPSGDVTTYAYSDADELAVVDAPGPGSKSYTYWPTGERRTYVNELGATWTYSYDDAGRLETDEDPNGRVTTYGYDQASRLATVRQPVPAATCAGPAKVGCVTYGYDPAGRPTLVDYSDPATADLSGFVYDPLGRRTAVTVGADTETWVWNRRGELRSHTDTNGRTTSYDWDPTGNLTHIGYPGQTNPLVRTFDAAGRMTAVTDWAGRHTTFGWDRDANHRATMFPGAKNEDLYGYDQAGRMTQVTWKKGATVLGAESYTRPTSTKAMVDVASPSGAAGTTVRDHSYDSRDRLVGTGAEAFTYDPAGNLTETADGRLQVFDPAQQLCWSSPTATTGTCATPTGDATIYGYDQLGRRSTETTPGGNVTSYGYDQANRLTTATVPDRGVPTDGQYRPLVPGASRVADTTVGAGTCGGSPCARLAAGATAVQVSGVGNVPGSGAVAVAGTLTVVNPAGVGSVRVNPNGVAAAAEAFHGVGETVAVSFVAELDASGRIVVDAATATDVRVDVTGFYTAPSLVAGSNYWPTDAHRLADTRTGTQAGTCNGGICSRLGANQTVAVQVTGVGGVPVGATAVVVSVVALDPAGVGLLRLAPNGDAAAGTLPLVAGQLASGVVTVPLDAQGRLTVTATTAVDVLVDVAGWYAAPMGDDSGAALDLLDAPTQVVDTVSGVGVCNGATCATLVAGTDHRLKVTGTAGVPGGALAAVVNVGVIDPVGSGFVAVGYNSATGAMAGFGVAVAGEDLYLSATVPVAADGTISFTTTGTVDVTVDVVGVFVRPVDTWTYGYRSDGLRSSKQEAGSAPVEFSWDSSGGLPLLLAQHQGTATSYVVYGPGDKPIYQVRQDGSVLNLHHDQLGSTRLVTTGSNGSLYGTLTYDAYGRTTSDTTPWFLERPLVGYTGQYHDTETGLIYLRARHYDPSTGQFLTRDPIVGVTQEPYGYTGGNPVNATDPSGLIGWSDVTKAVSTVVDTVEEKTKEAVTWAKDNPGSAATTAATVACVVVSAGWCGVALATAWAARSYESLREDGSSAETWKGIAFDGVLTAATYGLVRVPAGAATGKKGYWTLLTGESGRGPGLFTGSKLSPRAIRAASIAINSAASGCVNGAWSLGKHLKEQ
jgi:RHS repeat-associated protein